MQLLHLGPKPRTPRWLEAKRARVSATDVPKILGLAPASYGTAFSVWARMTGKVTDEKDVTPEMEWGNESEELHARLYRKLSARDLRMVGELFVRSPTYDWLCATPDGLLLDGNLVGEGVWEAKAPVWRRRDWEGEDVPDEHLCQVVAQMHCMDVGWGSLSALIPPRPVWSDIPRDIDFETLVLQKLEYFYTEHVLKDLPPRVVAGDKDVINSLHKPEVQRVELPEALIADSHICGRLEEQIKDMQAEVDELETRVRAFMANEHAEEAVAADQSVGWTYKFRAGYERKPQPAKWIEPTPVLLRMKKVK